MELTTEDKERIEREAKRVWKDFDNQDRIIPDLLIDMGVYATLYERAQLAEEIRQLRNKVIDETIRSFDFGGMYTVPEIRKKLNSLSQRV